MKILNYFLEMSFYQIIRLSKENFYSDYSDVKSMRFLNKKLKLELEVK